ncbi:hypothetical protein FN846DRAFT_888566 [Sphaerosporella brunnea]|uniref:Uncharacterized protein n=1 Tax=Sphaerosporella brunnea TaxID=1250544 RepID=A0A5J5F204_9PEZI|nr:hypothetical protein FN846DRAFT_888566 [Sphaerosporella brunnea]
MNSEDHIPAYQRSTAASRRRMAIGPALSRPPRRPATAGVYVPTVPTNPWLRQSTLTSSSRSAQPQHTRHAPPSTGRGTAPTEAARAVAAAAAAADSALGYHRAQRTAGWIPPLALPARRPAIQQSAPRAPPPNNRFAAVGNRAARRVFAASDSALAPHRAQRQAQRLAGAGFDGRALPLFPALGVER